MGKNKERDKVLTLKNDLLFKAVYGSDSEESKFILKNLLNKILEREENPIVDITYKNPFQLKEYKDDKETILDIKVEADLKYPDLEIYDEDDSMEDEDTYRRKKIIDVEMQIVWHKHMIPRLLIYHVGMMRDALHDKKDYAKIKQSITICITDSIVFEETDKFMNKFYFMEEGDHFLFSKKTCIICIELPKVNPDNRPLDELSPLEICLEYLKYADENGSDYVDALVRRGGEALEMAEEKLKRTTEEELLREKALAREKFLMDEANRMSRDEQNARKAKYLAQKEHDLNQKEQTVDQREQTVDQREQTVYKREQDLEQREAAINKTIKQMIKLGMDQEALLSEFGLTIEEIKNIENSKG